MKKNKAASFMIISAVVWGAVFIGTSIVLKGTPYKEQVLNILLGGIAFHMFFIWIPLGNQLRKKNIKDSGKNQTD